MEAQREKWGLPCSSSKHKEGPRLQAGDTCGPSASERETLAPITRSALSLQVCQEASRIGWDRGQGTTGEGESVF